MKPKGIFGLYGIALAAILAVLQGSGAGAAEFYVAIDGDDTAQGTRLQPFRTLAAASRAAQPGDVCVVRRGLYRETLKPVRSGKFGKPILYTAAPGETVTLSGAVLLEGWQVHSGAVYKIRAGNPIQILVDGLPALSAPGIPGEELHPRAAWWTAPDGVTYARFPNNDGPAGHRVEAQSARWTADLTGLSHIALRGFGLVAGGIAMDGSQHCRAEDCHLWWAETGIVLGGKDNEIAQCSVVGGQTAGVVFTPGSVDNRLLNCLVRGDPHGREDATGIRACGTAHSIQNATVSGWPAGAVVCSNLLNGRLAFSDLRVGRTSARGIPVLRFSGDGKGTVAAFNRIGDNRSPGGAGIFLDGTAENYVLHHNLTVNQAGAAFRIDRAARYLFVCNNTCATNGAAMELTGEPASSFLRGSRMVNNILPGFAVPTAVGAVSNAAAWENNFLGEQPGFTDPDNGNFTLSEGSPCVEGGRVEPDFTSGSVGKAPDIGAYEYGTEPWTAGCATPDTANETSRPVFHLTLESATPGAEVRYTLDGRAPGPTSMIYTGPIHAVRGAIRAKAFRPGMEDSPAAGIEIRPAE